LRVEIAPNYPKKNSEEKRSIKFQNSFPWSRKEDKKASHSLSTLVFKKRIGSGKGFLLTHIDGSFDSATPLIPHTLQFQTIFAGHK